MNESTHQLPWVERSTIVLDGSLPPDRRFRDVPQQAIRDAQMLLEALTPNIPAKARHLAHAVRLRTINRFHDEFTTLADMVNVDWRDLVLANVSYDLVLTAYGCSTIALPTPSGPVVARNMDWHPEGVLARSSYAIRTEVDGGLQLCNAGWPGAVGVVTGMSGRGFAVVLNAVPGDARLDVWGYPVLLWIRRVLDTAENFSQALKMLSEQRLAAPALLTLVGSENAERVVIERTSRRFALRWPEGDEPLVTTNHYRKLELHGRAAADPMVETELVLSTCYRYEHLLDFFRHHTPETEVTDNRLLYALSDPDVIQEITAQHIIMRPRQQTTRLFIPRHLTA